YGGLTVGPKIIDEHVKENMRKAARDVQSGRFAREWIAEHNAGEKMLKELMNEIEKHPIERVGALIRRMSGLEK
ncbi:MAG: ketol-acid reductoisomerase, partial [Candidatus Bathyarchaeota archaeon]|nr:ketol-acid reductoisomerase [Candidatus Bathyarchaeota archaeon]